MSLLLGGSLAAAFAAGMVAFFAPCCAGVMLPAYLAAIGGGHRLRVARLSAIYVAGVALVVLPITLGAATIASSVSRWHPQLFTIGGLMMIAVAVALWRGTMLPVHVPQPRLSGSAASSLSTSTSRASSDRASRTERAWTQRWQSRAVMRRRSALPIASDHRQRV